MEYTVKKNRANRIAMRSVAAFFLLVAVARLLVVVLNHEKNNLLLTLLMCACGWGYGLFLLFQTLRPQAYDITYVFGDQTFTIQTYRKELKFRYHEITDLGYVIPNDNVDYSIIQLYIGKEQYIIPFAGKSEVGKALHGMLKIKCEEAAGVQ